MIDAIDLRRRVTAPVDLASLALLRVALGGLVAISMARLVGHGWAEQWFLQPCFRFAYYGFDWVQPPPAPLRLLLFWGVGLLGVLVAAGLFYRVAIVLLFLGFSWIQLLDVTNYLNHYVLVSYLCLLSAFLPLNGCWSLDAALFPSVRRAEVPRWQLWVVRAQIAVVYFHAGLAKATPDWLLHAEPLQIWLTARAHLPVIVGLLAWRPTAFVMSWAGFLFDTTIVGFLLWRRTRAVAYAALLGFHTATWLLFPIGMFPLIMTAAATVFFDPSWPRRWLTPGVASRASTARSRSAGGPIVAFAWAALQLVVPLRTHLYGGNVLWHEQGMRLSWRVMCREKNASVTYLVDDLDTGRTVEVPPHRYLDARQEREFSAQPDLVLQLAHRIARDWQAAGHPNVRVRADVWVSLNGRPATRLVDPNVDLGHTPDGLGPARWVLPAPGGAPVKRRFT